MKEVEADAAFRRARFLLAEARANAKRDQATTYVMRVLSNLATIGSDANSAKIKDLNRHISSGSAQLLEEGISIQKWRKTTINEHPVPLKQTWNWMLENSERLTEAKVWDHFVKNPMVIVTKAEDARLNQLGLRSSGGKSRYNRAGFSMMNITATPRQIIENHLSRDQWGIQ